MANLHYVSNIQSNTADNIGHDKLVLWHLDHLGIPYSVCDQIRMINIQEGDLYFWKKNPLRNHVENLQIAKHLPSIHTFKMNNKTAAYEWAKEHGVPFPKTLEIKSEDFEYYADTLGVPFVVKPNSVDGGNTIRLITNKQELFEIQARKNTYLAQRYIDIINQPNLRFAVVGGKPLAGFHSFVVKENEFRSNLPLGYAVAKRLNLSKDIMNQVRNICKKMRIDICGIDVFLEDGKILFNEINPTTNFTDTKRVAQIDLMRQIALSIKKKLEEL